MFKLSNGETVEIEKCEKCDHDMVNVDRDDVTREDLIKLREKGIRISNPDTEDLICLVCHAKHFVDWYENPKDDEDDNYHNSSISSLGSLGGFFGGGSGGFGGFGGGNFSGGGASSSW